MNARSKAVALGAVLVAALCTFAVAGASPTKVTRIQLEGVGGVWTGPIAWGYGSIWAASHVGQDVYRINPRTNKVVKRINVGENQCVGLTTGAGAVWVWNCAGETGRGVVYKIDPRTNRVVSHLNGMYGTFGDGSLWTQSQDWTRLLRVDPRSDVVLASIKLPIPLPATGHVFPAAVCDGSLWSVADTAVVRYDTATNKVAGVIQLPGAASATSVRSGYYDANYAACAAGKVWVGNLAGLYSIDESTNTATRLPIPIKSNSQLGDPGLVAAGNQVFVRTSDRAVTQVDAETGKAVHIYPAGGGGGEQIAVANGSLWVGAAALGQLWREPLQ